MHHLPVPMGKYNNTTEIAAAIRIILKYNKWRRSYFANTRNDAHHLGFVLHDVFKGTRWQSISTSAFWKQKSAMK